MIKKMLFAGRQIQRLGQTSLAMNKLAITALRSDREEFPEHLKDTMQGLGATYIKLGQLIASSPTIFPDSYVEAFQSCLDQTDVLPYREIEPILEKQLGTKLKTHFRYIDKTPLASASIAQVHAAELITGEQVVLKIQKPTVKKTLETDFQFLQFATQLLEIINPKAWKSSIKDIVHEIRDGMLEECDFRQEANNIEEFAQFLKDANIENICVPTVYPDLSTDQVLVMERFFGVPISDVEGVNRISKNPELSLVEALNTWFLSLKQCQLYHADLHAGNVMMLEDGRIGFIDFGIVGRLSDKTWEGLTSLAVCVPAEDFDGLALALSKIGATKEEIDLTIFTDDLRKFWQTLSSDQMLGGESVDDFWKVIIREFSQISSRHGIRFPREFTLLVKQFLYFDRYIRLLAPDVEMFDPQRMKAIGF